MKNEEDWEHLKPFGYAPGNYMNTCRTCNQVYINLDKCAINCRTCAEAKYKRISGATLQELLIKFAGIDMPEVSGEVKK